MKVRIEAVPIPDSPAYWAVELEGREPHHFRIPPLSVVFRFTEALAAARDRGRAAVLEACCAAIGACWRHETLELETPYPSESTDAALATYSQAVQLELADAGYSFREIMDLSTGVADRITDRIQRDFEVAREAEARANFSGAPPAGSPSSSTSAPCSAGPTPTPPTTGPTISG